LNKLGHLWGNGAQPRKQPSSQIDEEKVSSTRKQGLRALEKFANGESVGGGGFQKEREGNIERKGIPMDIPHGCQVKEGRDREKKSQ